MFASLPGFEEADAGLIDAVLEEGGRICEQVVFMIEGRVIKHTMEDLSGS